MVVVSKLVIILFILARGKVYLDILHPDGYAVHEQLSDVDIDAFGVVDQEFETFQDSYLDV